MRNTRASQLNTGLDSEFFPHIAVRFGRVPKREKAKILAAMQKVNQNSQEKQLSEQLEDENRLLATILQAHEETCDYTKEKVAPLVARARTQPVFANCPPQMVSLAQSLPEPRSCCRSLDNCATFLPPESVS